MISKIPKNEIPTVPVKEWEKIVSESKSAHKLLNSPDFQFFRDYLRRTKDSAILLVATNSIKDVLETQTGENGYSSTIKTTKEEQLNEIAGCIKFVDKLVSDLDILSKQEQEYLKLASEKKINIEVTIEDAQREV